MAIKFTFNPGHFGVSLKEFYLSYEVNLFNKLVTTDLNKLINYIHNTFLGSFSQEKKVTRIFKITATRHGTNRVNSWKASSTTNLMSGPHWLRNRTEIVQF